MKFLNKNSFLHTFMILISVICVSFAGDQEIVILKPGDPAPVFQANDDNGELWNLSDFLNKKYIVVYFYPAAMTGGCTAL